jgi:uncharacterized protein with HEPN domain
MFDQELVREILSQILESAERIKRRFSPIRKPDDFWAGDDGIDRLDGICMMLVAMGENLKTLDKITKGELFRRYPQVDWSGAKGIRDVLSHHYYHVDPVIVFDVCREKLPGLVQAINAMREEIANGRPAS